MDRRPSPARLLQPSYIPDKDQRKLRELVRYRKSLVGERTQELNRLQKMVEGANIKLSGTAADINGKSARNILEYLLTGEAIDDLNGIMTPLQRRMMKELLSHLDELNVHIRNLDDEINNFYEAGRKAGFKRNPRGNRHWQYQRAGHHFCYRNRHEPFSY